MTAIITTLTCDNCGQELFYPIIFLVNTTAPENCYFCSLECVKEWIEKRLKEKRGGEKKWKK